MSGPGRFEDDEGLQEGILQGTEVPVQGWGIPEAACSVAAAAVQEAARLKAEGLSHDQIVERFGLKRVEDYIAIGFYPEEVWRIINVRTYVYNNLSFYNDIGPSLALRIPPVYEIQLARGGTRSRRV